MKKIYKYFWLFIFGSVFGWLIEGIYSLIMHGKLINHSCVVIGPFNMIYGVGALCLTFLLYKYRNKNWLLQFIIGFIGGSIIEYVMSLFMETVVGFPAWDYSNFFLNINGRVCFTMSLLWGILGIFWIQVLYPCYERLIEKMNYNFWYHFMIALFIFLILDGVLTILAIERAKDESKGIKPQNRFEEVLDRTFNQKYLKNMFNDTWKE